MRWQGLTTNAEAVPRAGRGAEGGAEGKKAREGSYVWFRKRIAVDLAISVAHVYLISTVVAVRCARAYRFSKPSLAAVPLIANFGIEGDAHAPRGPKVMLEQGKLSQ